MRAVQTPPTQLQRHMALKVSPVLSAFFNSEAELQEALDRYLKHDPLGSFVYGEEDPSAGTSLTARVARRLPTPEIQYTRLLKEPELVEVLPDEGMRGVFLRACISEDPLPHYVRGLESWQDYLQARSKHWPVRGI